MLKLWKKHVPMNLAPAGRISPIDKGTICDTHPSFPHWAWIWIQQFSPKIHSLLVLELEQFWYGRQEDRKRLGPHQSCWMRTDQFQYIGTGVTRSNRRDTSGECYAPCEEDMQSDVSMTSNKHPSSHVSFSGWPGRRNSSSEVCPPSYSGPSTYSPKTSLTMPFSWFKATIELRCPTMASPRSLDSNVGATEYPGCPPI